MTSTFVPDLLTGQTALVTGGGSGLGRAIAEHLRDHGAKVAIASRRKATEAAREMRVTGYDLDVRDAERCKAVVAEVERDLGPIDVLVNNAAGNFLIRAEDLSPNGWRAVLGIVLDGTFHMSRAVGPAMLARGKGSIVNILTAYVETGAPFVAHSGAAKAGVLNLTRSLAVEWGPKGVRVNAVAPGPIVTEGASLNLAYSEPEAQDELAKWIPMGRLGQPADVAEAVLFLCSPAARWITGDCLYVDGGQWMVGNPFVGIGQGIRL